MTVIKLEQENSEIRTKIKELNQDLNNRMEKLRYLSNIPKKKNEKRPLSSQIETATQEELNNDKILNRLKIEEEKLQKRLDQISEPSYFMDLKSKIEGLLTKIEKTKK